MTPRRRSSVVARASDPLASSGGPQGVQGKAGKPGDRGLAGPSVFREISESSSTELYGRYSGFLVPASLALPLECGFDNWDAGDVLQIEYWVQLPDNARPTALFQVQISLDGGDTWQAVTGSRSSLTSMMTAVGASISIALPTRPLVRLYTPGVDCGPGPEGATVVLRTVRWAQGTYQARGRLVPPLTGA